MKIVGGILIFCCLVISVCILYLVKSGVSLHAAPYITPSIVTADLHNISKGVFVRLFPDLQQSHYVLWGLPLNNPEEQKVFDGIKDLYEQEFKASVQVISNPDQVSAEIVKACAQPCWILFAETKAHELSQNPWIEKNIRPLQQDYISLTWIDFQRGQAVPENCLHMKYLDFNCLKVVEVQEVARKMKKPEQRYFFMQKYQEHDYFLFVEEKH